MASGTTLAIKVLADVKNALKGFGDVGDASESLSSKLGGIAKVSAGVGLALGGMAIAGAGALAKIGADFDDAYDSIAVATGATGATLAGLEDSFKSVFSSIPTDMGSASTAIGDVNTMLGLTGKPLEEVSKQFIELSRITGTDLSKNIDSGSKALNNFGLSADDQGAALDFLFKTSQATGIGFDKLADDMSRHGVVLREAGLSWDEAAGLLGNLNKVGLDAADVVPAFSKAMAVAAKDGKSLDDVLGPTIERIKAAGSDADAAGIAMELFGAKAGPKLAAGLRDGTVSLEDLTAAIDGSGAGILETAANTDDWMEKLQVLRNKVLVKLEPVAAAVFGGITTAVEKASPYIERFTEWLGPRISDAIAKLQPYLTQLGQWLSVNIPTAIETVRPIIEKLVSVFIDQVIPILVQVGTVIGTYVIETLKNIWAQIQENVLPALEDFWSSFEENVLPALETLAKFIAEEVLPVLAAIGQWVQEKVLPIVGDLAGFLLGTLVPAFFEVVGFITQKVIPVIANIASTVAETVGTVKGWIETFVGAFTGLPGRISSAVSGLWDGIKDGFRGTLNWIIDAWNNFEFGFEWDTKKIGPVTVFPAGSAKLRTPNIPRLHTGGIFTGGTGPYHEGPAILQNGEGVFTRDQMAALGGTSRPTEIHNHFAFHGPVYGVDDMTRVVVDALAVAQRRGLV